MGTPDNSDTIPSYHVKKENSEEDGDSFFYENKLHIKEEFDYKFYPECTVEMVVREEEDIKPSVSHLKQEAELILEGNSTQQDDSAEMVNSEEDESIKSYVYCSKQEMELMLEEKFKSGNGTCSSSLFSCDYCNKEFKTIPILTSHTIKYHLKDSVITKTFARDKKNFQCSQCDFKHSKLCTLKSHMVAKHTEQKPYKCTLCNYKTAYPNTFKDHFLAKHTNEKPHKCSLCNYKAVQSTHLKRHIRARHTLEKPHKCTTCSFSTVNKNSLTEHILSKHTETSICEDKTKGLSYFSLLISNQEDKSNLEEKSKQPDDMAEMVIKEEETITNPLVSSLKQKSELMLNEKSKTGYGIHSDTVVSCYYCNEVFKTISSLRSHIVLFHLDASIITNDDPHDKKFLMCSLCDYKDTKHSRLEFHLLAKHTEQKLYQCSICQYKTAYASSLRDHKVAKHSTQKPHQCTFCDFKSVQATNLRRHILATHQCTFCDYSSVSRNALRDHIFAKHNEKSRSLEPTPCDYKTEHSFHLKYET